MITGLVLLEAALGIEIAGAGIAASGQQHHLVATGLPCRVDRVPDDGAAQALATLQVFVLAPPASLRGVWSGPLVLDADERELWVVNTDSGSVSVVDVERRAKVAEISVGERPRTITLSPDGGKAWVACQGEDMVVAIDVATRALTARHKVGTDPFGGVVKTR